MWAGSTLLAASSCEKQHVCLRAGRFYALRKIHVQIVNISV